MKLQAMQRLAAGDKVTYEPTPGAKKEKPADWEADVPVVKSEASSPKDARKFFKERGLHAPAKKSKPQESMRGEGKKKVKSDAVEYVPTPGAKKEKPAKWEADVPVVQTCKNLVDAARKLQAAKAKHMPKPKLSKPHKAKAPANPEPKKKKPTKASNIVEAMAARVK